MLRQYRLRTIWGAEPVTDFAALAPYRSLVAITRELGPNEWIAEALPRADQHSWLDIWRTCEAVYHRSGKPDQTRIVSLIHQPRERVLIVVFAGASE